MELAVLLGQVEIDSTGLLVWGIVAVLSGVLILVVPRVLNYVVALYLIVIGVLQIIAALQS